MFFPFDIDHNKEPADAETEPVRELTEEQQRALAEYDAEIAEAILMQEPVEFPEREEIEQAVLVKREPEDVRVDYWSI